MLDWKKLKPQFLWAFSRTLDGQNVNMRRSGAIWLMLCKKKTASLLLLAAGRRCTGEGPGWRTDAGDAKGKTGERPARVPEGKRARKPVEAAGTVWLGAMRLPLMGSIADPLGRWQGGALMLLHLDEFQELVDRSLLEKCSDAASWWTEQSNKKETDWSALS
jgi:hypothetical protein